MINDHKERILSLWKQSLLKEVTGAVGSTTRVLRDSLLAYLEHLSKALAANRKMDDHSVLLHEFEAVQLGKLHGTDRADNTDYLLTEVISDYLILRKVISEVLEAGGPLPSPDRDIIHDSIDQAVNASTVKFSQLEANRLQDLKLSDSALDSVPDALVVIREDATIGYINRQTEIWFGYERGELFGKNLEILIPERYRESHREKRSKYFEKPTPRPMGSGLELFFWTMKRWQRVSGGHYHRPTESRRSRFLYGYRKGCYRAKYWKRKGTKQSRQERSSWP